MDRITPSSAPPNPQRSYKDQIALDRISIKNVLNQEVNKPKFRQMTVKDREDFIRATMRSKLEAREANPASTTARREHPTQYDEDLELHLLRSHYWKQINSGAKDNDAKDDAEPLPTGKPRIKTEPKFDDDGSELEDNESEDDEADVDSDDQSGAGEDEPDRELVYKVVSRDFVISIKTYNSHNFGLGIKTHAASRAKAGSFRGRIEPREITKQQPWKTMKPAWRWVDGEMVVWPPFEVTL